MEGPTLEQIEDIRRRFLLMRELPEIDRSSMMFYPMDRKRQTIAAGDRYCCEPSRTTLELSTAGEYNNTKAVGAIDGR